MWARKEIVREEDGGGDGGRAGREDGAGYMGDQGKRKQGDGHEGRWIGTAGEGEEGYGRG